MRAIDAAGNVDPTPASFTWTIDTAAPDTAIDSQPTNPSNSSSASFSFSGAGAGGSFECKLDAGAFAPCTSPQAYSSLADGSHTFSVRAIDAAGNVDPTPASFTWTIDTAAPDTAIDSQPTDPSNSSSASFSFSGAGTGGSFECKLDAGAFAPCTSPQAYSSLAEGSHTFSVRAIDAAGNVDPTPASFTWTIDTAAPDTAIDSQPTNPSNSSSASFSFSGAGTGGSFECKLDAGAFAPCTSPQAYSSLADGSHTFSVRAIDAAGNVDPTPASFTWTIDTAAPDTAIDSQPTDPSNSSSASFSFSGAGTGGSFECKLDAGAFAPCTSPQAYSSLADGSHTFSVRAIDAAGNVDPTPASFTWTIDTAAPDTAIDSQPTDPSNSSSASFSFSGAGTGGSFECKLDAGAFAPCTSPQAYSSLADGSHTFSVRAIDAAGNVDPTPASFTWTIDTAAPDTAIDSQPTNPSNSSSASFSFSGAGTGGSFECKLDAGAFAPCTSPQAYSSLADGSHTFSVRAIDAAGNVDPTPASFTWTIDTAAVDNPPVAVNDTATVTEDSGATSINVLANDTDIDGGPKTIQSVTQPAHGTVVITGGGTGLTYSPNPNYCNNGSPTDNFTYTLNGGSTATVAVTVTCVDDNPVAVNDTATVAEDSGASSINVLANDTDIDGGPKTIVSVTQPAHGTVAITGGGTGLTYTPNPNYCNNGSPTDSFSYTLNGGSTANVRVTVTCVDDPPVAVNDTASVPRASGPNPINVLANDTDIDGGPKTIASVTQPAHGTVVITGGGTGLTYQPARRTTATTAARPTTSPTP